MNNNRLVRDVVKVVLIKLSALAILYYAFFAPGHRTAIDPLSHLSGPVELSSTSSHR